MSLLGCLTRDSLTLVVAVVRCVVSCFAALTNDLWRCIDKPTRQLLRHMDDFTYLHALELLLLAFKAHVQSYTHTDSSSHVRTASAFQPPGLPASAARYFHAQSSPLPGEVILHVPDAFLRHILYGALQWHVLYAASRASGGASGSRGGRGGRGAEETGVVCVRMQRGWVYHECRLERFIQQHSSARH